MRGRSSSAAVCQAEQVVRNYQVAQGGVTIPIWLLAGSIGLFFGVVLGPAILSTTKEGSEMLAEYSRKRIRR